MRIINRVNGLIDKAKSIPHQRILTYLFFVFLSTVFWFLRALSDNYRADIMYPVKYVNIPQNRVVIGKLPKRIELQVEAAGFNILGLKLRPKFPIKFDISSFLMNTTGKDSSFILTNAARTRLSNELNRNKRNFRIINISPDTIFFHFTEMISKNVKVKYQIPDENNIFAKQYTRNGSIILDPDSINISGPASILDSVNSVTTEPIELHNLTDTLQETFSLQKISHVVFSRKKVQVTIPVDKFTESSFLIPIQSYNTPDSLKIKTFPNSVRITYQVTLSYFDRVRAETFKPYIDYNEAKVSVNNKVNVKLYNLPDYIHSVKVYPGTVQFLIEKQ